MEEISFAEKVYDLCLKIPEGKVSTYKELAQALGTKGYRAIGQVLKCNPYAPYVPCHRVVRSDGLIGGFKGEKTGKEIEEKRDLLEGEGIDIVEGKIDLQRYLYYFHD